MGNMDAWADAPVLAGQGIPMRPKQCEADATPVLTSTVGWTTGRYTKGPSGTIACQLWACVLMKPKQLDTG